MTINELHWLGPSDYEGEDVLLMQLDGLFLCELAIFCFLDAQTCISKEKRLAMFSNLYPRTMMNYVI